MKNWSMHIGLIGRGGHFFPSNDASQQKWDRVFDALSKARGFDERPQFITRDELPEFQRIAKAGGYKVIVLEKGLGR